MAVFYNEKVSATDGGKCSSKRFIKEVRRNMDELIYMNIAKNLSGEATEAEKQMLRDWLAGGSQNQAAYDDIKRYWNKVAFDGPAFDTAKAWEKVSGSMQTATAKRTILFLPWVRYSMAAAAMLLLGVFTWNLVTPDTITVAANETNIDVVLPDGSNISLRKGSKLHYPEKFGDKERNVELEGEAFFAVARDEQKPFIIDAQVAEVKVLGTSFNVDCNGKLALVVVKTGKVQLSDRKKTASVILTPGEIGILNNGKLFERNADTTNLLYWKTGRIIFAHQPLAEAIAELSRLKDAVIEFDASVNDAEKQQLVTGTYKSEQPLNAILDDLLLVTHCQWTKQNDNTYLISRK
jgi:transmembrane sensor